MPRNRIIRHLDFPTLVAINRAVVLLTQEKHEFEESDERRLRELVKEVKLASGGQNLRTGIIDEASLLMFRIAAGQHFHEGNKRTALVAGLAFLNMNGLDVDIRDKELVAAVDKAGIAAASFNDVHAIIGRLVRNVSK